MGASQDKCTPKLPQSALKGIVVHPEKKKKKKAIGEI
jgi:hypothetical protein